jgi:hypothetical protein
MRKHVFSIKDDSSNIFDFSGNVSFYFQDNGRVNVLSVSSDAIVRLISKYAKELSEKAKAEGHSFWANSD